MNDNRIEKSSPKPKSGISPSLERDNSSQSLVDLGKCLVIGGSGLLGRVIVDQLIQEGYKVRVLDINPAHNEKAECIIGDIRNIEDVETACQNIDTVFQTAAAVWDPNQSKEIYYNTNVDGNHNIIQTCIKVGVSRLIYTSTMDVVCSDERKNYCFVDETYPYPKKMPRDHYSRSKIIAEKAMLKANGNNGLKVVSIRPVGIFGEGDRYHVGNLVNMAQKGNKIKMGSGKAKFSHIYSGNAAYGHILAAKHLCSNLPDISGNCYFLSEKQYTQNLFNFISSFLEALNLPPPKISIPYRIAYVLAWLSEKIGLKSNFNRFSVIQTCLHHTFSSEKAKRDFGFKPIFSKEEAFRRTVNWFKSKLEQEK